MVEAYVAPALLQRYTWYFFRSFELKINEREENVFERYSSERQYSVSYKTFIFYIYIYNCNNFNSALSKLSVV